MTSVSTFSRISSASAFLISTPARAPRPTPTMIAIGVANPKAQGHAMMSTATAFTSACARRGCGPSRNHATNAAAAMATTAGTNHAATRSASLWMGARVRCAWLTICTMRASNVSEPTRSARITNEPVPLMVAPTTLLAVVFSTGMDSPVTMDSSTELLPSSTTPSTGIFSPGRTRRRSPGCTCSSGTSSSVSTTSPAVTSAPVDLLSVTSRRAVLGLRSSRARMAALVRLRARSSMTCPSNTSVVIAAAASK